MASEITGATSLVITKGAISDTLTNSFVETLTGDDYIKATQLIPTSVTAINLGSLATCGKFEIVNNDVTNYVDIFPNTAGVTFLHILAGSSASGYFASNITAPAARANTGSVQISYMIAEI
jgi:hypothetical protein